MSIPFVLIVVMAAVFGPVCSWLALRRARSWAVWFIFGVLLVASKHRANGGDGRMIDAACSR